MDFGGIFTFPTPQEKPAINASIEDAAASTSASKAKAVKPSILIPLSQFAILPAVHLIRKEANL